MPTTKQWDKIKWDNQLKKDKSIAYFNSLNAAVQMVKDLTIKKSEEKAIIKWRDWFIERWQEWYFENMPTPVDLVDPTTPEGEQVAMDLVEPKDDEELRYGKAK